jgi:hypothetical protein
VIQRRAYGLRDTEYLRLGLVIAVVAAFLLMFGILILQFDGLLVPGILLLEIPLAVTGGTIALILSGVGSMPSPSSDSWSSPSAACPLLPDPNCRPVRV